MTLRVVRQRSAFALVVVLALVAMTLGLSYNLVRTQSVDQLLLRNHTRGIDARSAAQTAMAIALRKLHDGTWPGADASITGNLEPGGRVGYVVTYTTGDERLSETSPDWREFPYRVTIDATGYSIDPTAATSRAEYRIRTVVQLVRKRRGPSAATRTDLDGFSLFQSANEAVSLHHPFRLNGNVHLQGAVQFSRLYPQKFNEAAYQQLFDDLRRMFEEGAGDYRPFGGRIFTPLARQSSGSDFWSTIVGRLNVPYTDVAINATSPVTPPAGVTTYRLFPKGKSYAVEALPVLPNNGLYPNADALVPMGTYQANQRTNPIGVFRLPADRVAIPAAVTVRGTVLSNPVSANSNVVLAGGMVSLTGSELPSLAGETGIRRLPAIMARNNVHLYDTASTVVNGWIVAGNEFHLEAGSSDTAFTLNGGVFAPKVFLKERTGWTQTIGNWTSALSNWNSAAKLGLDKYFPGWLLNNRSLLWGFYLTPRMIFNPSPSGVTTHVPDWLQPLHVPHPDDGGLIWNVISWTEPGRG